MPISNLHLQNFRSYADKQFRLSPHVNIVVGQNGAGKTNLLEALYVLCRGKSFRVADAELLNYDAEWFRLDAEVDGHERALTLKKTGGKLEKRLRVDNTTKARLSAREQLRVVLFEPRDMQLLTGSPERRREYLDAILEQLELGYSRTLSHYRRALTQRNTLLKQKQQVPPDHLFVWNVRLSELGAQVIARRRALVATLSAKASETYSNISGTPSEVAVQYQDQFKDVPDERLASALLHALEQKYPQDRERGFTSIGPHRDDVILVLNGAPAAATASRGETRSLVVMLKLLEAQLLDAHHDSHPLMLLDDVFGELDASRRKALAHYLVNYQTVITTTDAEMVSDGLTTRHKVITITD